MRPEEKEPEEIIIGQIEKIIERFRKYIPVGKVEKKSFGEVFTPFSLVNEMLDTLPVEVWSNPNLKWADLCNGMGNFMIVIIKRLMIGLREWEPNEARRYRHIVENMIYVAELQVKNMFLWMLSIDPKSKLNINIYRGDSLHPDFDKHMKEVWKIEKFDIIVGNPPYQEVDSNNNRKPGGTNLYMKFIKKSLNLTEYLLYISPLGWMAPGNSNSVNKFFFKDVIFKNNTLLYIESGVSEDYFDVGSKFTSFLIRKGNYNIDCLLKTKVNNKILVSKFNFNKIKNLFFLPSLTNDLSINIFDKVIYSSKIKMTFKLDLEYDIRRNEDIRVMSDDFPYKIYNTGTQIRYSKFKPKSYDKNKVIISGSGNLNPFFDNGTCSTANNTLYMLVSDENEGKNIVKLLNSKLYNFILKYTKYSGFFTKEIIWSLPMINININSDYDIYRYFNLTPEEIKLIEDTVK